MWLANYVGSGWTLEYMSLGKPSFIFSKNVYSREILTNKAKVCNNSVNSIESEHVCLTRDFGIHNVDPCNLLPTVFWHTIYCGQPTECTYVLKH